MQASPAPILTSCPGDDLLQASRKRITCSFLLKLTDFALLQDTILIHLLARVSVTSRKVIRITEYNLTSDMLWGAQGIPVVEAPAAEVSSLT